MNDKSSKGGFKPGQEPLPPNDKQPLTLMDIGVFAKQSNCFKDDDIHFIAYSKDKKHCWPCFGKPPWHNGTNHIVSHSRLLVCETKTYKELLLAFYKSPSARNISEGGIRLGINGTDTQLANRLLLFSPEDKNICNVNKCYCSVAFFGKYGIGIYDLKTAINKAFDDVEKTRNVPAGLREEILSKTDDNLNEETEAWNIFFTMNVGISLDMVFIQKPELEEHFKNMLKSLQVTRDNIYNDESKKTYFPVLYKGMLQQFCSKFIDKLRDEDIIVNGTVMFNLNSIVAINSFFGYIEKQQNHFRTNGTLSYKMAAPTPPSSPVHAHVPVL